MMRVRVLFGTALAVVWLAHLPCASGSQFGTPNEKFFSEKTLTGQLLNVDTKAKLISVRGSDQKEIIFNYNDDTQVISADKTVQGLTGKAGAQLRITYREERGINTATRIELVEKQ